MRYEWDEIKRRINLQQHGIDFADVPSLFAGEIVILEDDRYEYNETRFIAFGLLLERVIAVVYTERGEGIIRLISARKASKNEAKQYYRRIAN
ncbi:MAG: BrnT family toxin [Caldilineaceae bacterium]